MLRPLENGEWQEERVTAETPSGTAIGERIVRIHRVISRALDVTIKSGSRYSREGLPDTRTRNGLGTYLDCLATLLYSHHMNEDAFIFPYYQTRAVDAPYERLLDEHQQLEPLIERIRGMVAGPAVARVGVDQMGAIAATATEIRDVWVPHIDAEESWFGPEALSKVMSVEARLDSGHKGAHNVRRYQPGASLTLLPFIIYNLEGEERAVFEGTVHWIATKVLVPMFWRKQREKMGRLLLQGTAPCWPSPRLWLRRTPLSRLRVLSSRALSGGAEDAPQLHSFTTFTHVGERPWDAELASPLPGFATRLARRRATCWRWTSCVRPPHPGVTSASCQRLFAG